MKDIEVKNAIAGLTNEIREIYQFSLFPTSELYKEPEEIADKMGGGILYNSEILDVSVCRCGNGFLMIMPKTRKSTMKLKYFAQGLSVLFLKLKYEISEELFREFENMRQYSSMTELYHEFADEILCPLSTIESIIEQQTKYGEDISIAEITRKTGLNVRYIDKRIKDYHDAHQE